MPVRRFLVAIRSRHEQLLDDDPALTQDRTARRETEVDLPRLDPYLCFDGNCAEAMAFCQRTLGERMQAMLPCAESP